MMSPPSISAPFIGLNLAMNERGNLFRIEGVSISPRVLLFFNSQPFRCFSSLGTLGIRLNYHTLQRSTQQQTLTSTGKMAAIIAPVAVVAPRVVAPKARASRTLRATVFKGARVSATPKVRAVYERRGNEKALRDFRSPYYFPFIIVKPVCRS